jgi:ATP-dependent DNA helicase Q1
MVELLLLGYLEQTFSATAYTTNAYIGPASNAIRFTRLSASDVEAGKGLRIECSFVIRGKGRRASKKTAALQKSTSDQPVGHGLGNAAVAPPPSAKRPLAAVRAGKAGMSVEDHGASLMIDEEGEDEYVGSWSDSDDGEEGDWSLAVTAKRPAKRPRPSTRLMTAMKASRKDVHEDDEDVIFLSD